MKAVPATERPMNVTFNYKDCANKELGEALDKLSNFTGWKDSKDLYRFAKLKAAFDRNAKAASIWYRKLIDKHCNMEIVKKDGKVVLKGDGRPATKPKWVPNMLAGGQMDFDFRDRAAFEKDYKQMAAHEFTIKVFRWSAEELHAAGLTAAELKSCAKLLDTEDDDMTADLDEINEDTFQLPDGVEMDLTAPELEIPAEDLPPPAEAPAQSGEPAL